MSAAAAPSQRRVALVQLCASHINSRQRVDRLTAMLQSWQKQVLRPPMHLSISFASDELKTEALRIVTAQARREANVQDLSVLSNKTGKSQFQHYQQLVARLERDQAEYGPSVELWCIFTDDDDESHPERTRYFAAMLNQLGDARASTAYIYEEAQSDSKVDKLNREYFHYCVRVDTLRDFMKRADPQLLAHPFTDMMFTRFLRTPEDASFATKSFKPPFSLLVQWEGDANYLRASKDPWQASISVAHDEWLRISADSKSTTEQRRAAEREYKRLELLRYLCSFASIYRPNVQQELDPASGLLCPAWSRFLDESRFLADASRKMHNQPDSAKPLFDPEEEWKPLYEDLIRGDPEFRLWIDSPRIRMTSFVIANR